MIGVQQIDRVVEVVEEALKVRGLDVILTVIFLVTIFLPTHCHTHGYYSRLYIACGVSRIFILFCWVGHFLF